MRSGITGQAGRKGAVFAGSNFDESESGAIRDKKFEGRSQLKAQAEQTKKKVQRQQEAATGRNLEEDYITNLQKQVATMETQIKLLKDREVDQKNKASGYETLLRDGIPLNEHFLALKNKFNNEQDALKKQIEGLENDMKFEKERNEHKTHQIEILKKEFSELSRKFQHTKDEAAKKTRE